MKLRQKSRNQRRRQANAASQNRTAEELSIADAVIGRIRERDEREDDPRRRAVTRINKSMNAAIVADLIARR
jgi:hypothetical protein